MTQPEFLCAKCAKPFHLQRRPRLLSACSHLACELCLGAELVDGQAACPQCKARSPARRVEDFKVDWTTLNCAVKWSDEKEKSNFQAQLRKEVYFKTSEYIQQVYQRQAKLLQNYFQELVDQLQQWINQLPGLSISEEDCGDKVEALQITVLRSLTKHRFVQLRRLDLEGLKKQLRESRYEPSEEKRVLSKREVTGRGRYAQIAEKAGLSIQGVVDLSALGLVDEDIPDLSRVLGEQFKFVKVLKLAKNKIGDAGLLALIDQLQLKQVAVGVLNLSLNRLTVASLKTIEERGREVGLREVYLTGNAIPAGRHKFRSGPLKSQGVKLHL